MFYYFEVSTNFVVLEFLKYTKESFLIKDLMSNNNLIILKIINMILSYSLI
jgi:hypothetical protein